jgi:hypothetical protein
MSEESRKAERVFDINYRRHPLEVEERALLDERLTLIARLSAVDTKLRVCRLKLRTFPKL